MLPFMKPKNVASIISEIRKSDGNKNVEETMEANDDSELTKIAETLISAVHMKDAAKVAEALEDAFEHLESQPHSENENE
jgi:hypothetical protein